MCGQIKRSQDVDQAVDFALAYALADEAEGTSGRLGRGRRAAALEFITYYVPVAQRAPATTKLAGMKDEELTSKLSYWGDVVL